MSKLKNVHKFKVNEKKMFGTGTGINFKSENILDFIKLCAI